MPRMSDIDIQNVKDKLGEHFLEDFAYINQFSDHQILALIATCLIQKHRHIIHPESIKERKDADNI